MIKIQILDFNREPETVFDATFQSIKSINGFYYSGKYILEVNDKVVFDDFVTTDHELTIKNI